ncbi:MAG: restriction endonuclease [Thermodesulfovibrionales bacterium]|nr:restriction endonuclease [Thermodesulfovibrionales bacterium]
MAFTIVKASGRSEEFKISKLVDSLIRSGASPDIAWNIAKKVEKKITRPAHTKHIFRMARRLLKQYTQTSDMKYSIKRALYSLGPAGYQFEKYFSGILMAYGYEAETNRFMAGYCVTHEVDVFAVKDNRGCVIECKYHSNGENPTDVKTALYIHSRFEDIKKAFSVKPGNTLHITEGWLVTNTRCTSDAQKYAECVGLKIVSWKYPPALSLEKMIEQKMLYPVTVLSSIKKSSLEALFRKNIMFAKDIADMDEQHFLKQSGLDHATALALKKEADALCLHA